MVSVPKGPHWRYNHCGESQLYQPPQAAHKESAQRHLPPAGTSSLSGAAAAVGDALRNAAHLALGPDRRGRGGWNLICLCGKWPHLVNRHERENQSSNKMNTDEVKAGRDQTVPPGEPESQQTAKQRLSRCFASRAVSPTPVLTKERPSWEQPHPLSTHTLQGPRGAGEGQPSRAEDRDVRLRDSSRFLHFQAHLICVPALKGGKHHHFFPDCTISAPGCYSRECNNET